jgi:transcriptional regulator with XRE-family HTH domain
VDKLWYTSPALTATLIDPGVLTWGEVRKRRGLSQATLAARAGLTVGAIYTLESGRNRPQMANRLAILESIIDAAPLDEEEMRFVCAGLDLDERAVLKIQRDLSRAGAPKDAPRERVHRHIDQLMDEYGVELVTQAVYGMAGAMSILREQQQTEAHRPARTVVVKSPPVQKPGYVEHTETDYEVPAPPAAAAPPAKKRQPRRA